MTADHAPIELSWEWRPSKRNPVIRFSIESVAVGAGSADDPDNRIAASGFQETMAKFPLNMEWFDHFDQMSRCRRGSQDFWAFDLEQSNPAAKAYFFPRDGIETLSKTITTAPHCTSDKLKAWNVFRNFAERSFAEHNTVNVFMVSIDLLDPEQSRTKIYFRDSRSSFAYVIENMTLGGRISDQRTDAGLRRIRKLWDAFFGQEHALNTASLPYVRHPTAGILYLAEFRLGIHYRRSRYICRSDIMPAMIFT